MIREKEVSEKNRYKKHVARRRERLQYDVQERKKGRKDERRRESEKKREEQRQRDGDRQTQKS